MPNYAIYARSAIADEIRVHGQIQTCIKFTEQHNGTIYQIYRDNGHSGLRDVRPAFQNLMKDIVDNKVDFVVATDLARLSRSLDGLASFMKFCAFFNVNIVTINEYEASKIHSKCITQNVDEKLA